MERIEYEKRIGDATIRLTFESDTPIPADERGRLLREVVATFQAKQPTPTVQEGEPDARPLG